MKVFEFSRELISFPQKKPHFIGFNTFTPPPPSKSVLHQYIPPLFFSIKMNVSALDLLSFACHKTVQTDTKSHILHAEVKTAEHKEIKTYDNYEGTNEVPQVRRRG